MQRLVYSPKAFIFVKQRNGNIADLSKYTTAGSVTRRLNAVSSASFILRNPNMLFTAHDGNHAAFFPMDPVTIYLQRLRNRPVRVFTGFLDETPYIELYPGTIEFTASCTIKKLLYNYFDPALPYTMSFLAEFGWIPDGNGGIYNPRAFSNDIDEKDGGMGALLFETMKEIGGWNSENIKIEGLPKDLIQRMQNMFRTFDDDNREAKQELEALIERLIGAGNYGSSGGDGAVWSGSVKGMNRIIPAIVKSAARWAVPAKMAIAVAILETGLTNKDNPSNPHYGWYQWDKKSGPPGSYSGWGVTRSRENGCYDLGFASDCFCEAAAKAANRNKSYRNNLLEWAMAVQGVNGSNNPLYPREWTNKISQAEDLISKYGDTPPSNKPESQSDAEAKSRTQRERAKRRDGRPDKNSNTPEIFAPIAGNVVYGRGWHESSKGVTGQTNTSGGWHWHSGVDVAVPAGTKCIAPYDGRIAHSSLDWSDGGMVHFQFTEDVGDIKSGTIIGWGHISKSYVSAGQTVKGGDVVALSGSPGGGPHVHFIQRDDGGAGGTDGNIDPMPLLTALQAGKTSPTSAPPSGGSGGNSGTDTMMANAKAVSLAMTLNWASVEEQLEAVALSGNKSLMNDKPLLPFVQQMAESSLRQFQSMPNGDFFAFYPDYFGETWHRPPYWMIDDIEILEGKVRLSDTPLVTHEYVLGDTNFQGAGSLANKLMSAGSVSILNAFVSDLVVTKADKGKGSNADKKLFHAFNRGIDQAEATKFLERYGARPNVEEYPMIRNPFFELFIAYQRFMQSWARQFLTPFKFTFMPELYPGGKVGMPEHGLQMFIEEVTHSWDYGSGFVTEAELSAPAAMMDANGKPLSNNLPDNMPTALLEVSSGTILDRPALTPGANGEMRPS